MNCESARELMSAYYDRELTPDLELAVREHLEDCPHCAHHLAQFEQLSKLATELREPSVPADMWSAIDSSIDRQRLRRDRWARAWRRYSPAAVAAVLLVAASLVAFSYWQNRHAADHRQMAATFGQYLERFHEQPERAEDVLLARYEGRLLPPEQAAGAAKFQPNAPDRLPQGFTRTKLYVLEMPCCTCTQTIYQDEQGHVLALFEHNDQQRDWFGDRPTITAECHGKQTCLVQMRDRLAACWKSGPRHLTIVGARDVEQVAELVAYLDARAPSLAPADSVGQRPHL
ncbi:MAG: zf-HC2 domain-containing protein [Pirellulales bacterium]